MLLQGIDIGSALDCPVCVSDLDVRQLLQILFLQQKHIPPGIPSSSRAIRPLLGACLCLSTKIFEETKEEQTSLDVVMHETQFFKIKYILFEYTQQHSNI